MLNNNLKFSQYNIDLITCVVYFEWKIQTLSTHKSNVWFQNCQFDYFITSQT